MIDTASRPSDTSPVQLMGWIEPSAPDPDVLDLVAGNWEEAEPVMGRVVQKIRARNARAIEDVVGAALGVSVGCRRVDDASRMLALETLAIARVEPLEENVRRAIFEALASSNERLRFTAIAAASDLSRAGKVLVRWAIERRASDEDESPVVRAAAEAFLRTHRAARRAPGR